MKTVRHGTLVTEASHDDRHEIEVDAELTSDVVHAEVTTSTHAIVTTHG